MKEMTCIVCPNGCKLSVTQTESGIAVSGAQCKRGVAFAKTEISNPTRSLTTTVATAFADTPRLSVKTMGEIEKDRMFEAMRIINGVLVARHVTAGETILSDVCGARLVATSNL